MGDRGVPCQRCGSKVLTTNLGDWCQTRGARLDVPVSALAASSIPRLRTGSDEISSLRVARREDGLVAFGDAGDAGEAHRYFEFGP